MSSSPTRRRLAAAASVPLLALTPGIASAETEVERPDSFTSAFTATATPDAVIDSEGAQVDGEAGASGTFSLMVNSDEEIICYDIELRGVTGEYESPAKTATHIHQAAAGDFGPPRLAFPNPEGDGDVRTSSGCLKGPFTTGLEGDDGTDTGEGFSLAELEANPQGFAADTHTADFAAGAVRGQLTPMPVGGVDTGLGGTSDPGTSTATLAGLGALTALALGGGAVAARRRVRA